MTSTARITAHPTSDKELIVRVVEFHTGAVLSEEVLTAGQVTEKTIHGDHAVVTFERVKETPDTPAE